MPRVPEELILRIKSLADEGLSTTEIGDVLHKNRSIIAGIINRWGKKYDIKLKRAPGMHGYAIGTTYPKRSRAAVPDTQKTLDKNKLANLRAQLPPAKEGTYEPSSEHACDFWGLTLWRCQWPYGSRVPYTFCGAPKDPDRNIPYCTYHLRMGTSH